MHSSLHQHKKTTSTYPQALTSNSSKLDAPAVYHALAQYLASISMPLDKQHAQVVTHVAAALWDHVLRAGDTVTQAQLLLGKLLVDRVVGRNARYCYYACLDHTPHFHA